MGSNDIVFGLLDVSAAIRDPLVASKYRDFTLSWSRYGYRGPVIEAETLEGILARALARGSRFCLIQAYGHIIRETWIPGHWGREDFHSLLARSVRDEDFLVRGWLVGGGSDWYGLDPRCCLVNLEVYRRLGAPPLSAGLGVETEVPQCDAAASSSRAEGIEALVPDPRGGTRMATPRRFAWSLIALSLRHGIAVRSLHESFGRLTLSLEPEDRARTRAFARYLRDGLSQYERGADAELGPGQVEFLDLMDTQTKNARRGVFLFNIEPYADVETPPSGFESPVTTLYSVAAGFKPNRILATHGMGSDTRVVYFDYSRRALEVRRRIVEGWDGADFPAFIRTLFEEFPHTDTHYFMWADLSPLEVDWGDVERMWAGELERWGGAAAFAEHWRAYSRLEHEYLCLDIVDQAPELLARIRPEARAAVWWSNAFFTMYSNWHRTGDQRRDRYERWSEGLARRAPEILVYGSDYNNVSVNSVRAAEYWRRYREGGGTPLEPCSINSHSIRM